ncbi:MULTISPECIES: hypothetical protein [unclassified Mesorhizobium]|uniref:hypothetical protein n=1 Tax=unclassified Mesorhizobium TaxID=325217 RepID=UPI00333BC2E5
MQNISPETTECKHLLDEMDAECLLEDTEPAVNAMLVRLVAELGSVRTAMTKST